MMIIFCLNIKISSVVLSSVSSGAVYGYMARCFMLRSMLLPASSYYNS